MSFVRSSATIGGFTLLSRVFGFVRDMLQASIIGANGYSDAFFVAFKLPNFFRRIFAEGAFNAAFVPLFAGTLAAEGRQEAERFAREAMAVLLAALLGITALFIVIMPWFMLVLAPGFVDEPEKFSLTVQLTRITFPYLLFISLVTLLGGVLNSLERFAAVAATPILMNLCFIASLLCVWWLRPSEAAAVQMMAIGVSCSGAAQFLWLVYFCRKAGFSPRLIRPRLTPAVKKLFLVMSPAVIGGSVAQINLMVDTIIASFLPKEGSISYLYYADRINELPLAVIGIAVGTVLLPMLSKQLREGREDLAHHSMNRAIEMTALLTIPAACALLVIAEPVIRALFEHGAFTAEDTRATAPALITYAAGLPAFVLIKVLSPGFYARQDTKTPFKIASLCILLNFVLNLALMYPLQHVGMALATTIAGWVNAAAMAVILHRRGLLIPDTSLRLRLPRIALSAAAMSGVLWVAAKWLSSYLNASDFSIKCFGLLLLVSIGMAAYGVAVIAVRAVDPQRLKGYFKRSR